MTEKIEVFPEDTTRGNAPVVKDPGRGRHSAKLDPGPGVPALDPYGLPISDVLSEYPILLERSGKGDERCFPNGGIIALKDVLSGTLEGMDNGAESTRVCRENFGRLLTVVEERLVADDATTSTGEELSETALDVFLEAVDVSETVRMELKETFRMLWMALPSDCLTARRNRSSFGALFTTALSRHRRSVLKRFTSEAGKVLRELETRLRLDQAHSEEGRAVAVMGRTFGHSAGLVMDISDLAENLPPYRGTIRMSEHRRRRLSEASAVIRGWLESEKDGGAYHLVFSNERLADLFPGANRHRTQKDTLSLAAEQYELLADETLEFLRSLHIARLEIEDTYEPARDDEPLARMDWRSLTDEETGLIPPVVVLEEASRIRKKMMSGFLEFLESSHPLHVLITDEPYGVLRHATESLYGRSHAGLAAYAMANGRIAVLQSSLTHPKHLYDGFRSLVGGRLPKVALISLPVDDESFEAAWRCAETAVRSRVTPCFLMDPEAGDTWAECFRLEGNPDTGCPWPTVSIRLPEDPVSTGEASEPRSRVTGEEPALAWRCTLADYAVYDPESAETLKIIPSEETHDQIPVADYLELPPDECARAVPYTRAVAKNGAPFRLRVGPAVIDACRERMRFWRLLQELGGINSEFVRRAEKGLRDEAEKERASLRADLDAKHGSELERQRRDVVSETINRLVDGLMGNVLSPNSSSRLPGADGGAFALMPAEPISPSTAAQPLSAEAESSNESTTVASEGEIPEGKDADIVIEEPYINSALCTSCSECTNLNPTLFKYNENKQATITDPGAVTFAMMVKAAAKCESRCIHPGKPRADDLTATPELVAMAAKYN